MPRIKLTKGEFKKQRDALKQYERYLPTLQLKKQQLQLEILHRIGLFEERHGALAAKQKSAEAWLGFLAERGVDLKPYLMPAAIIRDVKNIAGVDIPVFLRAEFDLTEYDLFSAPLWVDAAIENLRGMVSLKEELRVIEQGVNILRHELRITNQRVNLFEKVKIPEAREAVRLIKIYLGDQMSNAVGRSKMAKSRIEESLLQEVAA